MATPTPSAAAAGRRLLLVALARRPVCVLAHAGRKRAAVARRRAWRRLAVAGLGSL